MSEPLKIAIAGLGTVGAGVMRIIDGKATLLGERCGRPIEVTAVSARDRDQDRGIPLEGIPWYDDAITMAGEADADVFVELIGGEEGVAKSACEVAIGAGRHVVTANKALIACHGTALACMAETRGCALAYEAAVAGGIPIV